MSEPDAMMITIDDRQLAMTAVITIAQKITVNIARTTTVTIAQTTIVTIAQTTTVTIAQMVTVTIALTTIVAIARTTIVAIARTTIVAIAQTTHPTRPGRRTDMRIAEATPDVTTDVTDHTHETLRDVTHTATTRRTALAISQTTDVLQSVNDRLRGPVVTEMTRVPSDVTHEHDIRPLIVIRVTSSTQQLIGQMNDHSRRHTRTTVSRRTNVVDSTTMSIRKASTILFPSQKLRKTRTG